MNNFTNPIQKKIYEISQNEDVFLLGLRPLARRIDPKNPPSPQSVKHHRFQLQKNGLLHPKTGKDIKKILGSAIAQTQKVVNIPLVGRANCGTATWIAEEDRDQYLPVSESLLKKTHNIFALQATGQSMNNANINGKSIDEGDYVIVDFDYKTPNNSDYVLSIINGSANIKKFLLMKDGNVALISESNTPNDYPPIVIGESDNFMINGKVIQVIKNL